MSFYLPDASTLTTSRQRYEIVERSLDVVLIIRNIEAADAGEYQCNFEDTHGTECFSTIQFEPEETVQFCTENDITYHAYVGDSVTLECCVNNYESQSWRDRDSNDVISENDHITYEGTHLVINPVTLEHRGDYSCTAEKDNNYVTIMASLEVYSEYSPHSLSSLSLSLSHISLSHISLSLSLSHTSLSLSLSLIPLSLSLSLSLSL